jgi:hypothetical protein
MGFRSKTLSKESEAPVVEQDKDPNCQNITWRGLASYCENNTEELDMISSELIGPSRGVCLDAQCYDRDTLAPWLKAHKTLPHNRAHFTTKMLSALFGEEEELTCDRDEAKLYEVKDLIDGHRYPRFLQIPLLPYKEVQSFLKGNNKKKVTKHRFDALFDKHRRGASTESSDAAKNFEMKVERLDEEKVCIETRTYSSRIIGSGYTASVTELRITSAVDGKLLLLSKDWYGRM